MWDYATAFSRNLGLISEQEQQRLRRSCVAIAGMGGVGGGHLVTLLRLGVGRFHLADLDYFDVVNMNRQYGASALTVGRHKVDVMAEVARSINPEVELTLFRDGLTESNADAFFQNTDVAIDGIDFFAIAARRLFFQKARERGMFALTSGPLGFSATLHIFSPVGMSFDEYFDIHDGMERMDQIIAFMVGLAPKAIHLRYFDLSRIDVAAQTGPSSSVACQLCSALIGAEVLNLLLNRKAPRVAPHYFQFDAYQQRYVKGRLWFGNRHPVQRWKRWRIKSKIAT
jgi:hypothetical protein